MKKGITITVKEAIGYLHFNNVEQGNALSRSMMSSFAKALNSLEQNQSVRVVVIQSEGEGAFCAGASLKELLAISTENEAIHFFSGFAEILSQMQQMSKFILGSVHGKVVGGGLGLVAGCDYVIAHQNAAIKLSELAIGIGPYVIAPAVTRKIGATAFEELSLAAQQWRQAKWSQQKGLYAELVTDLTSLQQAIQERASQFAQYPPEAVKTLRAWHWKNTAHWSKELFENAAITGRLALEEATQNKLKQFFIK
ncbi:MAG: enoyl-CoA hydratase/isomerase family protein [Flavobacteriaceae bacterium]